MVVCIENPQESIKKSQEVINELSDVTGYNINTQKQSYIYIKLETKF